MGQLMVLRVYLVVVVFLEIIGVIVLVVFLLPLESKQRFLLNYTLESNSCADKLTNYGIHSNVFNWWNEAPSFILEEWRRNSLSLHAYRFCNF
ncbi:hypothetical protein Lal_00040031 [Lupinus albus]|nr:hypothetical protein Lal_00040031 [Lupinus albus]